MPWIPLVNQAVPIWYSIYSVLAQAAYLKTKLPIVLADVGAQLKNNFDRDRAGLALRTLSSERERKQALDVFARIIQSPEFPQEILLREKARIISSIKESSTKPDYIGERELMKMLYSNHPYGFNEQGEIDTLNNLQREDLLAFYRSFYVAGNAVIAIIGDVTQLEAAAIAEQLTDSLPSSGQKTRSASSINSRRRDKKNPSSGNTESYPNSLSGPASK